MTKYYAVAFKTKGKGKWKMTLHLHKSERQALHTALHLNDCTNVKEVRVLSVKI